MSAKNWLKFIVLGLVWGSSFMWIKIAVQEIGPMTLVAFRISFAAGGLLLVMLWRKAKLPPRSFWKAFAVIGLFNLALPFVLISWSEQYIPSVLASILNSTVPLFTTLIAHFFVSDDRMTPKKFAGLIIGFLGVIVLLSNKLNGGLNSALIGPVVMLLAAISYAAATVYARRTTQGLTPDVQAFGQQVMALIYILPTMLIFEAPFRPPHLPITWMALAWLGLLGTAFATLLYYSLLHTVGPTRTSLVSYIFPLVGVVLGIIFLGEAPGWQFFAGGALVIGGIIVVNSKKVTIQQPMKTKDWFYLILLGLVWGTNFLWIKIAVRETGAITTVAYRVIFAIIGLTVVFLIRRPKMPGIKYAGVFVILGLLNVNLPFILISWAQKYIPSGMAAILNGFVPLFTALLAHIFIADDKFNLAKVIGLVISFGGVVVLMAEEHLGSGINYYLIGQICMLVACFLFTAGNVYARLKTQGMTADAQAYYQQIMALVVIVPMAGVFEAPFAIPHLPLTWVALAFLGALNTTAGTLLYFALINSVGASRTSLVTYIFPLVAVLLGFLFLGENPDWRFFVGGGLIFMGIILFNSRFKLLDRGFQKTV